MYKRDIKAMPMDIKEEIARINGGISVDDIMPLSEKTSTKFNHKEIASRITPNLFPNYWVVTDESEDYFYVVFETTLTDHQEKMFYGFMKFYSDFLHFESYSDKYGIY